MRRSRLRSGTASSSLARKRLTRALLPTESRELRSLRSETRSRPQRRSLPDTVRRRARAASRYQFQAKWQRSQDSPRIPHRCGPRPGPQGLHRCQLTRRPQGPPRAVYESSGHRIQGDSTPEKRHQTQGGTRQGLQHTPPQPRSRSSSVDPSQR